ncbi:MAG: exopolysaccharide biosynthesis protein [Puniceicoccaceae bacterium]|nr:MAG: exopolysaccharide biosynthesis protein [Puniceicoccaceae bacterium]
MPDHRLSHTLNLVLRPIEGEEPSLERLNTMLGENGFGLFLMVLSLPSALPVPAPGYSTPFGIVLLFLAGQMILARPSPWLPQGAARRRISRRLGERIARTGERFFGFLERWVRPRHQWISGRWGLPLMGLLTACMAALMILPIPLTNTAPALVIFLIGVGLSEKDGLLCAAACVIGGLAVAFYGLVIYLAFTYGIAGAGELLDWLRGAG